MKSYRTCGALIALGNPTVMISCTTYYFPNKNSVSNVSVLAIIIVLIINTTAIAAAFVILFKIKFYLSHYLVGYTSI